MRFSAARVVLLLGAAVLTGAVLSCSSPAKPTPVCTFTLTPPSQAFPSAGGTGAISVEASAASCTWVSTSNASWAVVTGGTTGTGSGSIAYRVDPNPSTAARTAALTVNGEVHAISQQGQAVTACTYAIQPAGASVADGGATGSFIVMAPDGCAWSAASAAAWVSITAGSPGAGNGTVSYAVAENNDVASRTAAVSVADQQFTISQAGEAPVCDFSVSPVLFTPCMDAGTLESTVVAPAGCRWTATTTVPWLTIVRGADEQGTAPVTVSFSSNYDAPRQAPVMVRWDTPSQGQNILVQQAGCVYGVTQTAFSFSAGGGSGTFDVLQQSIPTTCGGALQDRCVWSATASVPWITVTSSMPRTGDNPVAFTVAPNATGAPRTGTLDVRGTLVQVTQGG